MVVVTPIRSASQPVAPPSSSIRVLLRLEGLAAAAVSALLYTRTGVSWWLFAALWFAPDLSMLGYLASPCRGARVYNAFHTYVVPVLLAIPAWLLHKNVALAVALIWINHIGVDRLLGFGLKYADGFSFTHLGMMEKRRKPIPPIGAL